MKPLKEEKPLILVVDDETDVLDEVATVLTAANFNCRCCTTAEAAIAAAESHPPDLIISDINLHGHSGLEMCEQIKRNEALGDVPVMFLSGAQIPDIIRRSHAVGGTYYLRKPFDPEVLVELIDKALWMPHLVAAHAARREAVSGRQ
jgi:CheY-like chemotaxis protein